MALSLVLAQDDGNYGNDYGEYAEYQDYNNDYNQEDNMYYDYEENKKYVDSLVSNKIIEGTKREEQTRSDLVLAMAMVRWIVFVSSRVLIPLILRTEESLRME